MSAHLSPEFKKQIIVAAIRKLFKPDGHFCIIDFDSLMSLASISVPSKTRDSIRVLHCINYRDMDSEMKANLIKLTMDLLASGPDPVYQLAEILEDRPPIPAIQFNPNWLQKLLGKP